MSEASAEWVTREPAPRLRPYIGRYVGYRMTGFTPGIHRGFPSPSMTFVASIGPPIYVAAQTNPEQDPDMYRCVVGGLQQSTALIAHDGHQEGVTVTLTPLGSRALLGVPARELWDLSLELSDVVGSTGSELWERLQPAASWEDRFRVCDEVLSALADDLLVAAEVSRAWHVLVASHGQIPMSDLAREVGYSRQHLGRRFREEFGLTPKLAARVIRFSRARRMMDLAPSFVSLAQIAAVCGYYDQSHLNRDFLELGGCTPTELFEDLPFFQDDGSVIR